MKVSLIVPVYGVEKYIERCARSLFGQTHDDIEYIFVDDASPDRSIDIMLSVLEEYPRRKDRVRVVSHERNRGLSEARNTGIGNATGDYIWHIDSDDWVETDAVELLLDTAVTKNADMVVFDKRTVYENKAIESHDETGGSKEEYVRRLMHRESMLAVWGKFCRRELFTAHGVRFIEGIGYGEDFVVSPRIAYFADKIVKLDRPLYNYVQYNTGAYTNNLSMRSVESVVKATAVLRDFFLTVPDRDIYGPWVPRMEMKTKLALMLAGGTQVRQAAWELYPELDWRGFDLGANERLVMSLAEKGRWKMLDRIVGTGVAVKRRLGIK